MNKKMSAVIGLAIFIALPSLGESIRCFQNPNLAITDFSLSSVDFKMDADSASFVIVTQGAVNQWEQTHQGEANKKLATLSPEVAAYITDPRHYYSLSATMDRKATPDVCATSFSPAFAVDCFSNKAPIPAIEIHDVSDPSKPPLHYAPQNWIMFETDRQDINKVGGLTQWQSFTLDLDNVVLKADYLLHSGCKL